MTLPAATSGSVARGGNNRWLWVVLAAIVLAMAVIAAGSRPEGRAFDPDSTRRFGTRAFVELLERWGATVEVTDRQPPPDADVAVAFPATISDAAADELRRWVATGKTLVVADPFSDLSPPVLTGGVVMTQDVSTTIEQGDCSVRAVRDAQVLRVPIGSARFHLRGLTQQCYSDGDSAYLVVVPEGEGQIVGFGAPMAFTNALLGDDDNAVLAVALAAPRPGTKVAILQLPASSPAPTSLTDVVGTGVKLGLVQLVTAFVIYSWFRARRLGRPLHEPLPVELAGSELVSAVGGLLQQTKSPDRAAVILRSAFRRQIADRFGLPPDTSPTVLAQTVAARAGVDTERMLAAVADVPVGDENGLVALAQSISFLREELFHGLGV
ncbi:MAG: DUF4350 domain-containing protein [Acidimicrobiales bacterium]|nr:DUF4350 domain-containing protein [Acidimicrobiales bacterium]